MSHPGQVKPDGASSRTVDSGWMCGSFLGLAIVLVLPVVLVLGIMSAAGDFPVIVPICGGLGMLIAAAGFRSGFILTIEDDRLQMRMVLQKYVWYWQEIDRIEAHRLGPKLVLKQPVRTGLVMTKKVRISYFDPRWQDRPVMQSVVRRVELQQERDRAGNTTE